VNVRWTGFVPTDAKLVALYGKGKALQWDAAAALDWERPIDPAAPLHAAAFPILELPIFQRLSAAQRDQLMARFTQAALSQFLHGEQGALLVASSLVGAAPDYEAKLYAATQTMDEARHVEVFARYLRRCGDILPVDPSLQAFLDTVLGAASWAQMLIGMQVIVEGAALSSFHAYRARVRDPLLGELLDGVIRDEARHVGFGTLYLRHHIAALHPDEREQLADHAYTAVMTFDRTRADSLKSSRAAFEEVGVSAADVMRDAAAWLAAGHQPRADWSRDGITEFILPTLSRLGVLTPRVEQRFARARLTPSMTSPLMQQLRALVDDDPDDVS
jgi:hypothetical protein